MSRKLPITQKLAITLIEAAKKAGGEVVVETPDGNTYRFTAGADPKKPVDDTFKGHF